MSVINKMLRDLDHRHVTLALGSATGTTTTAPATEALRQGTARVGIDILADIGSPHDRSRLWLGLVCILAIAAAAGAWVWWSGNSTGAPTGVVAVAPVAAPVQTPVGLAPSSAPGLSTAASTPTVSVSIPKPASDPAVTSVPVGNPTATTNTNTPATAMNLRMESSLSARRALDALLSTPAPAAPRAPPTASTPPPSAVALPAASSPVVAASTPTPIDRPKARATLASTAPSPSPVNDNSGPSIQRQQQAGGDAIAQAQSLWNSGSHDAAMELMQQSIAATERSLKAGTAAGSGTTVLVPLVREMARMQLADGRYGTVWEMLTRLEPLLGNQADLWAIRGSAAQRLGRHPDSVHAYMMALQTRPDEQRWLLGTAVSLAALGQTTSAAEMAEKARAVGPVSKDILAYLRQTGVPLREQ
nr:hypothetical protein [Rhodoferax sp.]